MTQCFYKLSKYFVDFRFCFRYFQKMTPKFWFHSYRFEILKFRTLQWWKIKKSISQLTQVLADSYNSGSGSGSGYSYSSGSGSSCSFGSGYSSEAQIPIMKYKTPFEIVVLAFYGLVLVLLRYKTCRMCVRCYGKSAKFMCFVRFTILHNGTQHNGYKQSVTAWRTQL